MLGPTFDACFLPQASRGAHNDLPQDARTAPVSSITLPLPDIVHNFDYDAEQPHKFSRLNECASNPSCVRLRKPHIRLRRLLCVLHNRENRASLCAAIACLL